ncbi:MAG: hypothetical protein NZM12_11325, partial [Steroidobacteraceae bacterium]|nr:hypothetical protein [Steroidobacteraceae bacterium]MDW8258991.1 hypothetical protein [Gammaproteobacteria bacterium]
MTAIIATRTMLRLMWLLLFAAVWLLWWPTLGHSFQFDDWNVIVGDARVQSVAAWWQSMPGIRPLLKLSYALNHELGGDVRAFRAVNIALHAVNACLLVLLLQRVGAACMAQTDAVAPAKTAHRVVFAAAGGAALFAVHPVQTEVATYISGRSNALATVLALLALLAWRRYLVAGRRRAVWLGGAVLAFVLALAVKEFVVVLPLVAMLLHLIVQRAPLAVAARAAAPLFAALVGVSVLALVATPYLRLIELAAAQRGWLSSLYTQANGVSYLIGQLLLVRPPNPDPGMPFVDVLSVPVALRGALLLALIAAGVSNLRRRPAIAFAILWFFLWLAPTNAVLPRVDAVNDRQLYIALAGPAWLLGWFVGARWHRPSGTLLAVALVAALVLLAHGTVRQNRHYATEIAFWQ